MKKLLLSIVILTTSLTFSTNLSAQKNKYKATKTYKLSDFSKVTIEGGYKILLIQGNTNSLKVEVSDEDLFDDLKVDVEDEQLRVWLNKKNINMKRIRLTLTFKDFKEMELYGGIKLTTEGYLDFKDLELDVDGGADIKMKLKADNLRVEGEGGFNFDLDGVTNSFDLDMQGAGNVNAYELKSKDVEVNILGVGAAKVYATDHLTVNLEGIGSVHYKGNPEIYKNVDGIGRVSRR